jgi:hypothetical protein
MKLDIFPKSKYKNYRNVSLFQKKIKIKTKLDENFN